MPARSRRVARFGSVFVSACVLLSAEASRGDDTPGSELPESEPEQVQSPPSAAASHAFAVDPERPPQLEPAGPAHGRHYTLAERPLRLGLELLSAGATAATGALVIGITGAGLCRATGIGESREDGCFAPGIMFAVGGAMVAMPFGVYLGGELLGGDGSLGVMLGVGLGCGVLSVAAVAATNSPAVLAGAGVATLIASIAAYELTSDSNIAEARERQRRSVYISPFVDGERAGLLVFGAL
jgi:hypothetical protein